MPLTRQSTVNLLIVQGIAFTVTLAERREDEAQKMESSAFHRRLGGLRA
jgi:hypothetical protein